MNDYQICRRANEYYIPAIRERFPDAARLPVRPLPGSAPAPAVRYTLPSTPTPTGYAAPDPSVPAPPATMKEPTHRVAGIATVYNRISHRIVSGLYERFVPGLFGDVRSLDIHVFNSHFSADVLARSRSEPPTLWLAEDRDALHFVADLDLTEKGRTVFEAIRKRLVTEMSVSFTPQEFDFESGPGPDDITMVVSRAALLEISPVARGAYPGTSIAVAGEDPMARQRRVRIRHLERLT